MNAAEQAMQMELDGKAFYEKAAGETNDPGEKRILITLAEEEERHYRIFEQIKNDHPDSAAEEAANRGETVAVTKNIFQQMAEQAPSKEFGQGAQRVWREAIRIEEKSEEFYRQQATRETDETRRQLWNRIADEEKNHIYLIANMISFMADPESFVQSARYSSFMSWEGR
jgi:rubrerythrin